MVKRIRGIAFSAKVSPQSCNRMVDGARGVLNSLLADVFIFTDHVSGAAAGLSPGYGLTLVAETTAKNLISAEGLADVTDRVSLHLLIRKMCNDIQENFDKRGKKKHR
jgi:RNA 3'-terminal phosphate cyclase-like protein